mgnify:CR=1 FL=1
MGHVQLAHIALREHQTLFRAPLVPISRQRVPPARVIASNAKQAGTDACRRNHSPLQFEINY